MISVILCQITKFFPSFIAISTEIIFSMQKVLAKQDFLHFCFIVKYCREIYYLCTL